MKGQIIEKKRKSYAPPWEAIIIPISSVIAIEEANEEREGVCVCERRGEEGRKMKNWLGFSRARYKRRCKEKKKKEQKKGEEEEKMNKMMWGNGRRNGRKRIDGRRRRRTLENRRGRRRKNAS